MQTTKELFAIRAGEKYILYAPLKGSALLVEPGVIGFLNQVDAGFDPLQINPGLTEQLVKSGIIAPGSDISEPLSCNREGVYAPTSVTLLPTFDCNLRCVYCYSRGGESIGEVMERPVAGAAIDLIFKNAKNNRTRKVVVSFHGGGEPLLPKNHGLIDYALGYAKLKGLEMGLTPNFNVVTNGVHSEKTLEWAVNNFSHINVSLDGPEDIQNSQRPLPKAEYSFEPVMKTIRYFEKAKKTKKFNYGIRATITSESVRRMSEILEFFHSISTNESFHLEPLFECGRCKTTKARAPDAGVFLEEMIKTEALAKKLGVQVYYSGGSLNKLGETFCGACGSNFFVTPSGYVTTCLEACREEDAVSSVFFVGKYNKSTLAFEFDEKKIQKLKARKVTSIPHCENCFAKYNCCGDCPAKVFEISGDLLDPSNNSRCIINQGLLKNRLLNELLARAENIEIKTTKTEKKC
jgi:uncharacterized protein